LNRPAWSVDMIRDGIDTLVQQLSALSERELIEVLNRVFEVHARKFDGEGMNPDFGDRYALVKTHFVEDDDKQPYVQFMCRPSRPYRLEPNDEAVESGGCPKCGVSVVCTDKLATCPVYGTECVECT